MKENTSKEGLPENETRATFIVEEDMLNKLKDYAYTERITIKDAVAQMMEEFLTDKEVLERKKSQGVFRFTLEVFYGVDIEASDCDKAWERADEIWHETFGHLGAFGQAAFEGEVIDGEIAR